MAKKKYININDVVHIDDLISKLTELKNIYGNLPVSIKFKSEFDDIVGNEVLFYDQINIEQIDCNRLSYQKVNGEKALVLG